VGNTVAPALHGNEEPGAAGQENEGHGQTAAPMPVVSPVARGVTPMKINLVLPRRFVRCMALGPLLFLLLLLGCAARRPVPAYDLVIAGGTIYDGLGGAPLVDEVVVKDDRIAYVGPDAPGRAARTIDAAGLAVTPGFINMLSWATDSRIFHGRGTSDIEQGVTLEVFGEGWSMDPFNPAMKRVVARQGDIRDPIGCTALGESLRFLQKKGVSSNVASFVGASTVRIQELGEHDAWRVSTTPETSRMSRGDAS